MRVGESVRNSITNVESPHRKYGIVLNSTFIFLHFISAAGGVEFPLNLKLPKIKLYRNA